MGFSELFLSYHIIFNLSSINFKDLAGWGAFCCLSPRFLEYFVRLCLFVVPRRLPLALRCTVLAGLHRRRCSIPRHRHGPLLFLAPPLASVAPSAVCLVNSAGLACLAALVCRLRLVNRCAGVLCWHWSASVCRRLAGAADVLRLRSLPAWLLLGVFFLDGSLAWLLFAGWGFALAGSQKKISNMENFSSSSRPMEVFSRRPKVFFPAACRLSVADLSQNKGAQAHGPWQTPSISPIRPCERMFCRTGVLARRQAILPNGCSVLAWRK